MAALASALIAGQATTAFAFKNDTNNGPGSGKSTEVSLQAPGDNSDSSQSSGNNTSPTTIVEESSQSTDTSQSETSQTTETTTETTTDTTTAAETVSSPCLGPDVCRRRIVFFFFLRTKERHSKEYCVRPRKELRIFFRNSFLFSSRIPILFITFAANL